MSTERSCACGRWQAGADMNGLPRAVQTDLLERDRTALLRAGSIVFAEVKPHGYAAVRLLP